MKDECYLCLTAWPWGWAVCPGSMPLTGNCRGSSMGDFLTLGLGWSWGAAAAAAFPALIARTLEHGWQFSAGESK